MRLTSLYAFLLVLACGSESIPGPPKGLPYSAAFRTCGPADGPAVGIILASGPIQASSAPTPYVRMMITQPLEQIVDHSWSVDDGMGASYVAAPNELESAVSGAVTIRAIGPDSSVLGSVLLRFPTRGQISGGFTARWINISPLCG